MSTDIELQHKKLSGAIKWGVGLLGALIISPIIFMVVKGLVGLAIALFVGAVMINAAPAVANMLANWKLKLIKDEANRNPIETMQSLLTEKTAELRARSENITDFDTEVRNFDDQLEEFKRTDQAEAIKYQDISNKMHQKLEDMVESQNQAQDELSAFEENIKKAQRIYKMALAAEKVTSFSKSAEQEIYAKIREDVAFDAVRTKLNRTFATLNTAVARRSESNLALPAPQKDAVVDVVPKSTERARSIR